MIEKIKLWAQIVSIPMIMGFAGYMANAYVGEMKRMNDFEQRIHSDPLDVLKAEEHIKTFEDDKKQILQFQNHVDEVTHELVETAKILFEQRKQDSIVRMKDAVTNYQTKQQVDTLIKFWRQYNAKTEN